MSFKRSREIVWLCIFVLAVGALLFIVFPKNLFWQDNEEIITCDCVGQSFWYDTKCIGLRGECEVFSLAEEEDLCPVRSCEDIVTLIQEQTPIDLEEISNRASSGTDVILVIDSSNSMVGEKLSVAKQAAIELVDSMEIGDRIGIVSFSDDADIEHSFSEDKEGLKKSINNISVKGGTKYLPALERVEEIFNSQKRSSKKGIIFLSDGVPADEPKVILEKTKMLQNKEILVYTMSFGNTSDSRQDNILWKMASSSVDEESYFRSVRNEEDLTDAFVEAWQEIRNIKAIVVSPTYESNVIKQADTERIGVNLNIAETSLIGESRGLLDEVKQQLLCSPQINASVVMNIMSNQSSNESLTIPLEANRGSFHIPASTNISPGMYEVFVSAELYSYGLSACHFTGSSQLGNITITEESYDCSPLSCQHVEDDLADYDLALEQGVLLPKGKVDEVGRFLLFFDASESTQRFAYRMLADIRETNRLISGDDFRALASFSSEAQLIEGLTTDKELVSDALENIDHSGTTKFVSAFEKSRFILGHQVSRYETKKVERNESYKDVVMIFTDGLIHDQGGIESIAQKAKVVVDDGTCVFLYGYGSELTDNKKTLAAFREIVAYSQKKNGCGLFIIDPTTKELAESILDVFDGEFSGEEKALFVPSISIDAKRRIEISTRVVSATTGAILPASSGDVCVPRPSVDISLRKGKDSFPLTDIVEFDGEYVTFSNPLVPGRYKVGFSGSIPVESCDISLSHEEVFVIKSGSKSLKTGKVMFSAFLLVCMVFLSGHKMKRLIQRLMTHMVLTAKFKKK